MTSDDADIVGGDGDDWTADPLAKELAVPDTRAADAAGLARERELEYTPRDPTPLAGTLSVQQLEAIEMIVQGRSDNDVAQVVHVHRITVTRWRLYNLSFRAELSRRRQEVFSSAGDRVRKMLERAAAVVERQLDSSDEQISFRAARTLLSLAGNGRFAPPEEPADPLALLEQHACDRRRLRQSRDPAGQLPEEEDRVSALNDLLRRRDGHV